MYFFGVWEPTITALYRAALRPGDVVVDIGANVGTHALLAAHLVGPRGRVHAIEASPWIHARLRQNLATNGVTNVQTYNLAATEAPGTVSVFLHDERNLGGTTIVPTEAARLGSAREALVDGLPLGQIVPLEELRAARLIKMDVEGAEWLVAQGMRDVLPLLRDDAEILVEVNPAALVQLGGSLEAFLALFAAAGFQPFEVANRYAGDFYIDPPPPELVPLTRRDFELADLVFRKAR
nr:FkbM family methyltransferase [Falsiroseomonas tokyonensis]